MDKYEFNLKIEQLNKLVKIGDYKTAMRITDTIDWRRVHNAGLLTTVSDVYERNGEYKEAREILLLAYDRAPVGKRVLFKLAMLSIKEGDIDEAQAYYDEYTDISPQDSRKYIMEYLMAQSRNEGLNKRIRILEKYNDIEVDESWKYELAKLYAEAGRIEDCVMVCDEIMLLFGVGENVEKAAALKKSLGYRLSANQQKLVENREFYEDRLKSLAARYDSGVKENFPDLGLDNINEYKAKEVGRTTIDLGGGIEAQSDNAVITTELFPRVGGVQEARISETTFKGESVNPEFEVELKRAIAITRAHINEMKEDEHSSMEEIDEEVRSHMEKVERIKYGRFSDTRSFESKKQNRIDNYFDSRGLPRTYGSIHDYEELEAQRSTWISEEGQTDPSEEHYYNVPATKDSSNEQDNTYGQFYSENVDSFQRTIDNDVERNNDEPGSNMPNIEAFENNPDLEKSVKNTTENNDVLGSDDNNENNILEDNIYEPSPNVTITETASTRVMENYEPSKETPIFDEDDLINSYYDEEKETAVPTVSGVLAMRREENIPKSTIKSEERMEVVGDEEVYYTREEKTFVTKVKRSSQDESLEISNSDNEGIYMETDMRSVEVEEEPPVLENTNPPLTEDEEDTDTITIEENIAEENNTEAQVDVNGKVMNVKAPKSEEPREYLMRRPGSIIVEGVSVQKALENAIEVLKEVNELTKIKHAVLKIKASSLNARGVMNSMEKISGKDLIIEEAGDLNDNTIAELIEFVIDGSQTVVFSDTISGIANLIEANDLLHSMSIVMREEEEEIPVRKKNIVANIVIKDRNEKKKEENDIVTPTDLADADIITNDVEKKETEEFNPPNDELIEPYREEENEENYDAAVQESEVEDTDENTSEIDVNENYQEYEKDEKVIHFEKSIVPKKIEALEDDDKNVILKDDEFVSYALDYANKIDCVVPDRTKAAIEERVDYMKEDDIPLSRKNAIALIESAADLAEHPGIIRRLFGFMKMRYDKEDRLILREEHFKI